ncbi:ABC transporter permease [Streptosporangium sp. NPDC051022]|uniref:ABC transporter permease n=1 Tax=Streptosporangium sp. NPDC051022 TaxID=3155752 RepID=UPI0034295CA4
MSSSPAREVAPLRPSDSPPACSPPGDSPPSGVADRRWRRLRRVLRRPATALSALAAAVIGVCALLPATVAPYGLHAGDPAEALLPPGSGHLFGTDQLGRDLFSEIVWGARPSLQVSLLATVLALVTGTLAGLVAGYFGGVVDGLVMRVVDVLMAIPTMLMILVVIAVLGAGTVNISIAVAVAAVPTFARVMRAEVLRVRTRLYVRAALAAGVRTHVVLLRHVIPNSAAPVLSYAVLAVGGSLLATSGLSFLGFGAPPPNAEWGALAAAGRDYVGTAWWLTTFPGLMVVLTVLAATGLSQTRPEGTAAVPR